MRWNKGAACTLTVVALAAFAPTVTATISEACRDGEKEDSAQAVDDDVRIVDNEGWYYVFTAHPSVWKETNDVPGLQTEKRICDVSDVNGVTYTYLYSYVKWQPDAQIAGASVGPSGAEAQVCFCP